MTTLGLQDTNTDRRRSSRSLVECPGNFVVPGQNFVRVTKLRECATATRDDRGADSDIALAAFAG